MGIINKDKMDETVESNILTLLNNEILYFLNNDKTFTPKYANGTTGTVQAS